MKVQKRGGVMPQQIFSRVRVAQVTLVQRCALTFRSFFS